LLDGNTLGEPIDLMIQTRLGGLKPACAICLRVTQVDRRDYGCEREGGEELHVRFDYLAGGSELKFLNA
jgi:hypothetical protein